MLAVIFGPSGSGKSTVAQHLLKYASFHLVRTYSTRPSRRGRGDSHRLNLTYHEFADSEKRDSFIWTTTLFGNRYGTWRADVERALKTSSSTYLLDFPFEEHDKLKGLRGRIMGVLLLPPSRSQLAARLRKAGRTNRVEAALAQYDGCLTGLRDGLPELIRDRVIVNENSHSSAALLRFYIGRERGVI